MATYTWYSALQKCVCLHIDCSKTSPNGLASAPGLYTAGGLYGLQIQESGAPVTSANIKVVAAGKTVGACASRNVQYVSPGGAVGRIRMGGWHR